MTVKSNPSGAFLGDSDTQNITGAKTWTNTTFLQRNPAGTFSLTWVHPAITAAKERRAYQPYHYLVYPEGGTWYVKSGLTEAIDNSSATATTMIQWAMDNLTGSRTNKEVVRVVGTPSITKLTIPSYTKLDLNGSSFLQIAATNTAMWENSDTTNGNTDIEITGGFIDGNKANQTGGGTEAISMFRFVKCNNVWIHNTRQTNANYHSMRFNDCPTGIVVTDNIISNFKQEGVCDQALNSSVGACHHHLIANNYSFHSSGQPTGSCHVSTVNIADIVVSNNIFERNIGGSGLTCNGLRNVITNNVITDIVGIGITLAQGSTSVFDSSGSVVIGNTVKNCGLTGIYVQNAWPSRDIRISNNFVDTVGTVTTTSAGILTSDCWDVIINANTVKTAGGSGIKIAGNSVNQGGKHGIISDNICYNNGIGLSATDNHRAGISLESNSAGFVANVMVHGNHCYDEQGTQTQKYGVRAINTANCTIKNNNVVGNLTAGVSNVTNTTITIRDNFGYATEGSGSSTQSGNASTKVFNIAHSLAAAPTKYLVLPGSADAIGPYYLTADATNVIVTFPSAPPTGSSNLIFRWLAEVV